MIKTIEDVFRQYDGDGEFEIDRRDSAFSLVGTNKDGAIIYCTRPAMLLEQMGALPLNVGLLGKYGLPDPIVADWLGDVVGHRAVCFLGDLDPVDFLIFLWLRLRLPQSYVRYLGISDRLLEHCRLTISPACTIKLSESESKAMEIISTLASDAADMVGPKCMDVLNNGNKIELPYVLLSARSLAEYVSERLLE